MPRLAHDEMRRRVSAARIGRLATVRRDNTPHLVPVTYVLESDEVFIAIDDKPKTTTRLVRLANIEANPNVSLLIDDYSEDWSALWWVRMDGRASVIAEGVTFERALDRLSAKYDAYARKRPSGPVIVIAVTAWSGWSAG